MMNEDFYIEAEESQAEQWAYEPPYEEFDGENRMDQPGFWYGQPDINDEGCE